MTEIIINLIKQVPAGRVSTYGQIANLAGLTNGARQVSHILHSCTGRYDLPWHRIIRSDGSIALPEYAGGAEQRALLLSEGICFKPGLVLSS